MREKPLQVHVGLGTGTQYDFFRWVSSQVPSKPALCLGHKRTTFLQQKDAKANTPMVLLAIVTVVMVTTVKMTTT